MIDINVKGVMYLCRAAIPHLAKSDAPGGGSIVNTSSVSGTGGDWTMPIYNASKGAVRLLAKATAVEFATAQRPVRVNSIHPGFIRTDMSIVNGVDETTTTEFEENYLNNRRIPLGRVGFPDEIATTILFLASRGCRYITGADVIVDGGLTLTL